MKAKSVTLYDVAELAGVSYQTVSRVINQASHVSAKTRQKVEAAMKALNYVPNRVAQQLAGKLSQTLGLATTTLSLHAPSQIAAAIKSKAGELQFNVMISMVEQPGVDAACAAVNSLLAQRVDGLIVNIPLEAAEVAAVQAACGDVPVLFLDVSPEVSANHIVTDAASGADLAVEHLVTLGHRHIALLAGPENSVSARLRLEGWQRTLAEHQLAPAAFLRGDWSSLSGYQQVSQLLRDDQKPTAILVANDQMALGTLRAIHEAGFVVPQDISVIGFDDTEDSACFLPPLTTIRQDFRLLGEASVNGMVALIHQGGELAALQPVSLVERKTTAAPGSLMQPTAAQLADELSRLAQQISRLK
ncbi:LacI family DNA-binding transcriptional regulator [Enterobacter sp. Ap-916]|uniref:LacI family DNA-binding transcriptional regulator n=1 Tax=unclassified Enterobacter TaxID=2608935 RepID=UPI001422F7BA|nr:MULTISPECIES: LacI family DNA-binding transcriptional regulator [unclassified Enterobacter]NIF57939.1 LacI family DNA-binding transcriptional regulator [Enterobacter sp. Ap-867]NIG28119.1 LacI family DNA-binding transcriptional regulator [Enterobacter sp. Ap-916]